MFMESCKGLLLSISSVLLFLSFCPIRMFLFILILVLMIGVLGASLVAGPPFQLCEGLCLWIFEKLDRDIILSHLEPRERSKYR
jgi:hypothetical protein